MSLTSQQMSTLKAAILADGVMNAFPNTSDGNFDLAKYLNSVPAVGPVAIWRNDIAPDEIAANVVISEFNALTATAQNGLLLLTQGSRIDASKASVRTGFSTIFGGGSATVTALTVLAQRSATRFEAFFVSSQVSSVQGRSVAGQEVQDSRNS